jgi:hypothetical protein
MNAMLQPIPDVDCVAEFDATLKLGPNEIGLTIEVFGTWERSFRGSRETPYEPRYCDIRKVLVNSRDCTDWLSDDNFSKLIYDELYTR